jgi:hypothetical protein
MIEHFKEGFMKCAEEQKYTPPRFLDNLKKDSKDFILPLGLLGASAGAGLGLQDVIWTKAMLPKLKLGLRAPLGHMAKKSIKPGLAGLGIGALASAIGYANQHRLKDKLDKDGKYIEEKKD